MPKGVYKRTIEGEAKRAEAIRKHLPKTAFKPGVNSYPNTNFHKGHVPYNKGVLRPGIGGRPKKVTPK